MSNKGPIARAIDAVVATVSPERGLRRELARQQLKAFNYEGARFNRARSSTTQTLISPESSSYQRDRVQLMRESRDLAENGSLAAGLLSKCETYTVGTIDYNATTGDDKIDDEYEQYFADWGKSADYTGRHSFRKLIQLGFRGMLTDGDSGFIIMKEMVANRRVVSLLGVEADRIGNPYETSTNDPKYRAGMVFDDWNRILKYRIYERTLFGAYVNPKDIEANDFIHIMNGRRHDEYRGISAFHAALTTCKDIKDLIEFEISAAKWASAQAGVVKSKRNGPESNNFFSDGTNAQTGDVKRIETIEPGRINYIGDAEDFYQMKIERPGAAWQGFLQFLIRLYGTGFNLPYGIIFEMTGLSGPAARFEAELADKTFAGWQLLLQERALDKIKNVVLSAGIANGDIPPHPQFMRGDWMFPTKASIDVGRESAANVNEMTSSLKSMHTILSRERIDDRDERIRIAQEAKHWMELSTETGVPFAVLRNWSKQAPMVEQADAEKVQQTPVS